MQNFYFNKELSVKKLLLACLLSLTSCMMQASDINYSYFFEHGVSSKDIKVLEAWLQLGQHRDAIGNMIAENLGDFQEKVLADCLENKIQHWDYQLRSDLALPSLMKSYVYHPFIFLLQDLNRIDNLSAAIKKHVENMHDDTRKVLTALQLYRKKVLNIFHYAGKIGVAIDAQDAWGQTALVKAIHYNSLEFVLLCLQAGAHVNYVGDFVSDQKPLDHAMLALDIQYCQDSAIFDISSELGLLNQNIEIVKALVHAGAYCGEKNNGYAAIIAYVQMLQSSLDQDIQDAYERLSSLSVIDEDVFGSFDAQKFDAQAYKKYAYALYQKLICFLQSKKI